METMRKSHRMLKVIELNILNKRSRRKRKILIFFVNEH